MVELNRAVAVGMAFGAAAGLSLVDALCNEPRLRQYALLPAVRGDLLCNLGRNAEAQAEFERAATLARNARTGGDAGGRGGLRLTACFDFATRPPRSRVRSVEVGASRA